ncbi:hypothetical protein [Nocardia testacea]|uniref:hypothetical protein n=1 Tax=Nocardia testacea TaxID=248551 RepID=UPI0003038552|nr:hypothetical protein [Nocardia testacea]
MTENRSKCLHDAYTALRKALLTEMLLPVEIPDLELENWRPHAVRKNVVLARDVLKDMPGDPHHIHLVDQLALDWLTAVVLTRMSHVEVWCGEAADDALTRFQATLEVLRFDSGQ